MITVIIPTYNNQDTIKNAINSIINQTYTDWELIVVNDNSTDKTKVILRDYKRKLKDKLTIINNKVNIGAGLSRRLAIKEAKGNFITFLDSDDELASDFLQIMLHLQQQHDSDLVYSGVEIIYPKNTNAGSIKQKVNDYIMEGPARLQTQVDQNEMKFITGKLLKRSLFDYFEFSDRRIGEDVETLFYACYYAKKVRCTSYVGYKHYCRYGSLLTNKGLFYKYVNSADLNQVIVEFLLDKGKEYENIIDYFIAFTYGGYKGALIELQTMKNITQKDVDESWQVWLKVKKWFEEDYKELTAKAIEKYLNEKAFT